jgi:gamma-glutamyl:cysteine ligase YbdK (ATP-grasp superfamily)
MNGGKALPAFGGYGIELEYAIVDADTLNVRPIADRLLRAMAGHEVSSVERGELGWSNELVLHVIELKNLAPSPSLARLPALFEEEIRSANRMLDAMAARLMPTGAHPWMNPRAETLLWPGEGNPIYTSYDRLFNCRSHGWANVQSMHINLPFAGDEQFARLHAAIRLVLPLVPALAASSPIVEGKPSGLMDYRLEAYRSNQERIPSITGSVIPESVDTPQSYREAVLQPMYRSIEPYDPDGILEHEWLNSRGAIARFDRQAIEIRVADTQECPLADLAIAGATAAAVKALYEERWSTLSVQQGIPTETLLRMLLQTVREAEAASLDDAGYLAALGLEASRATASEVWRHLLKRRDATSMNGDGWWLETVSFILDQGTLARRISRATDNGSDPTRLSSVYDRLCRCLEDGRMFD